MPRDADEPATTGSDLQGNRKRIAHMLRCARDAQAIVGGDDPIAIADDMMRTRALVNCFTEIGEAASRPTPSGRTLVGTLPWRQIIGMRNIIVHVYWGIDIAELVKTVRDDLPNLEAALGAALSKWPEEFKPDAS